MWAEQIDRQTDAMMSAALVASAIDAAEITVPTHEQRRIDWLNWLESDPLITDTTEEAGDDPERRDWNRAMRLEGD